MSPWRSIRYQKGKLNVIKRQKNIISRSVGFADWFVEFTRYSKIHAKTVLKINWSVKTPWYKRMEVARYGLWVPLWLLHVWYFASTSDAMLLHFRCALISGYPSQSDGQYENRSKSHVQPFDRYYDARKKLVNRQPKLFKLTIAKPSFPWSHYSDNFSLSAGGLLAAFCF